MNDKRAEAEQMHDSQSGAPHYNPLTPETLAASGPPRPSELPLQSVLQASTGQPPVPVLMQPPQPSTMQQQQSSVAYDPRVESGRVDLGGAGPSPSYNTFQSKGGAPPVSTVRPPYGVSQKSVVEAYVLAISPLGLLGAHHFYLRRYYWGILYFFTFGLMGCGYVADWFRIPCLVKRANDEVSNLGHVDLDRKTLSDAYILWFPMGFLGFHHYYLQNYAWGVAYTFTFGLFGLGWLVDAFRMPFLVRDTNERRYTRGVEEKTTCTALALGISPLGVLGAHHYYLNRPIWGILYSLTLGLMGLGWVIDWLRMPALVARANKVTRGLRRPDTKTVDDAYLLWLPWGLLGFHHFYLGRPLWGFLYFMTLGVAGMGWLVDMVRIPCLVKQVNQQLDEQRERQILAASMREGQRDTVVVTTTTHTAFPAQEGGPSHGIVNPAGSFSPTCPYPPQQPYYGEPQYHQQGAAYGAHIPAPQGQDYASGQPPAYSAMGEPFYPNMAPPPYQPPDQQKDNEGDAPAITHKHPL